MRRKGHDTQPRGVTREEAKRIIVAEFSEYHEWPPQQGQVVACGMALFDEILKRGFSLQDEDEE